MGDSAFALNKISRNNLLSGKEQIIAETLLRETGGAFLYSIAQEPVDGVMQILERSTKGVSLPHLQIACRPAEAEFGSFRWHIQQASSAAGMLAPYLLLHRCISGASEKFLAAAFDVRFAGASTNLPGFLNEQASCSKLLSFKTLVDASLTGAAYDGILRPVGSSDDQFVQAKLKNAICGGLTFATLSALTCKTQSLFRTKAGQTGKLFTAFDNFKSALIAGIPAGIVSAESRSLLDSKGPASAKEVYRSCYNFAFLGAAFCGASASLQSREQQVLPVRRSVPAYEEWRRATGASESVGIRWLNRVADDYFSDAEYQQLRRTVQKFESRAQRNDFSTAQICDTFISLNRLLKGADARSSIGVQPSLCTKLVRETLENLAYPYRLDQGGHPTCVLNSIENIIASNHPEKYSKIVSDLALSGAHYYGELGTKLPRRCLLPDAEAREAPRKDGSRCFASQLMQYYLANLHWSYGGELPDFSYADPGTIKYQPIADGANRAALYLNGRILKDAVQDKHGSSQNAPYEAPNIFDNEVLPLFRKIIPRGKIQVIDHLNGIDKWTDENGRRTVQTITNVEQLRKLLKEMRPDTTICGVRGEKLGGDPGWHAVVLRNYDQTTDSVYLDNSWGRGYEHSGRKGEKSRIKTEKLFKIMTPPEAGQ